MICYRHALIGLLTMVSLCLLGSVAAAQNRRNQRPSPTPAAQKAEEQHKQNVRPAWDPKPQAAAPYEPTHFFQFERPGFTVPKISIEHDELGIGKISFVREGLDAPISDPLSLSEVTIKNIREILHRMSFLASTESYQYEKDMPQMGNNTFTLRRAGEERTVKYNWTTHKDAKSLIDEYRRIGNEFVWRFELSVARENQPLRTPKLLGELASLLNRGEISDPPHLLPLLTELSVDERMPLMARNTAERLINRIGKPKNR